MRGWSRRGRGVEADFADGRLLRDWEGERGSCLKVLVGHKQLAAERLRQRSLDNQNAFKLYSRLSEGC